jgi:hypothetical protein
MSHNFIVPLGKSYGIVPLPQNFRGMWGLGVIANDAATGNLKGENPAVEMLASLTDDLSPVDIGSLYDSKTGWNWGVITPSKIRPGVEWLNNRDYLGRNIARQLPYESDERKLECQRAYPRTGATWIAISEALNDVSGGDKYTKGWLNVNPAKLQHVWDGYLGGMWKFGEKTFNTAYSAAKGDDKKIESRDIPFLGKMYGNTDTYTGDGGVSRVYYDYLDRAKDFMFRAKGYEKDNDKAAYDRLVIENPVLYHKAEELVEIDREVKILKNELKEDDISDDERIEIEALIRSGMKDAIKYMEEELDKK